VDQVYNARKRAGVARRLRYVGRSLDPFIRARHAEQWSDAEIAAEWDRLHADELGPASREWVTERRREMGLASNAFSQRHRQRVAAKTREQLERAGLSSLAQLRNRVLRDRVAAEGWPADISWRAAQILSLIWDRGPMTKVEICKALGMPLHNGVSSKQLKGNGPGGSHVATLMQRGLLVSFRKVVRTGRRGGNVDLYTLPFSIQRRKVVRDEQRERTGTAA
jgi:hypothetical protein